MKLRNTILILLGLWLPLVTYATLNTVDNTKDGVPFPVKVMGDFLTPNEVNVIVDILRGISHNDNQTPKSPDDDLFGIFTGTPEKTLDVAGDINFDGDLYKDNVLVEFGKWISGELGIYYGDSDIATDEMNVGIGTSEPVGKLEIHKTGTLTPLVISEGNRTWVPTSNYDIAIGDGTDSTSYWGIDAGIDFNIGRAGNTQLFTISENGDIGIGIPDPIEKLEVQGNVSAHNPTKDEHLATKWYVDQQIVATAPSTTTGGGTTTPPTTINNDTTNVYNGWESIKVVTISTGGEHTCASLSDGSAKCWGDNFYGQLGVGTKLNGPDKNPYPIAVSGLSDVKKVVTSSSHSCALLNNGTARCWGSNSSGQLHYTAGSGNQLTPVLVEGLENIKDISLSNTGTCFSFTDAGVKCTGGGSINDIMGISSNPDSLSVSCAVDSGTVKCWGSGVIATELTPSITDATIVSGTTSRGCAILTTGAIKCWGTYPGDSTTNSATPVLVSGINNTIDLSVGISATCAVLVDNRIKCWGTNTYGQLGEGTTQSHTTPVFVAGNERFKTVSINGYHTCGILMDDTAICWGLGGIGQLGNGNTYNNQLTPNTRVANIENICETIEVPTCGGPPDVGGGPPD